MSIKLELNFKKPLQQIYSVIKKTNILHIVLIVLALHLFVMSTPSDGFIFDEAHYIPAARDTFTLVAANAEHTPLSKIVIGTSIKVFGDWWFGWRISSVVFSTLSIVAIYLIAKEFMSKKYALFASVFLALDMLFFVNGSIAILDAQAIFFGLFAVYFFIKERMVVSGLLFALSILSKEHGAFFLFGVIIYSAWLELSNHKFSLKHKFSKSNINWKKVQGSLLFVTVLLSVSLGGLYAYDIVYKPTSSNVAQTLVQNTVIVDGNGSAITTNIVTTNNSTPIYITNPIQHLLFAINYYVGLTPTINPEPQDFRPAWSWALPLVNAGNPPQYYGVTVNAGDRTWKTVSYLSQVNYPVTVFIIPTVILCLWLLLKKNDDVFSKFYLSWLVGSYLPWIVFSLTVQRMTFNYYFLYTVPILAMGVPWFVSKLKVKEQWKTAFLLSLTVVVSIYFMYYFPLNLFRA
jgi:4-amino-4-deoxy-L-arabinose transferase-like glycosyltransferase